MIDVKKEKLIMMSNEISLKLFDKMVEEAQKNDKEHLESLMMTILVHLCARTIHKFDAPLIPTLVGISNNVIAAFQLKDAEKNDIH